MPVTTSTTTVSTTSRQVLSDYVLYHSGHDVPLEQPPRAHSSTVGNSGQHRNPNWWPSDHRRVPDHRPVNRNLDRSQRPNGTNVIETIFIFTMLRGVQLNAVRIPRYSPISRRIGAYYIPEYIIRMAKYGRILGREAFQISCRWRKVERQGSLGYVTQTDSMALQYQLWAQVSCIGF